LSEKRKSGPIGAFRAEGWLCEPSLFRMTRNGLTLQIEPKVMQVLVRLAARSGEVVTRTELLDEVWAGTAVSEQVLSRAVSELRKVFEDDSRTPRVIETIAKSGYRLIAPVESVSTGEHPAEPPSRRPASRGAGRWPTVAVGLAVGMLLATWFWRGRPAEAPAPAPGLTASILLPAEAPPDFSEMRCFDLSPDGTRLVYTASIDGRQQLYVRRMDRDEVLPIPGTEGGFGPFFSSDGSQVGFYVGGKLQRIPLDGGDAVTLTSDASDAIGATWGDDGTIVYVRRFLDVLYWLPAGQGPRALTVLDPTRGEQSHFWPQLLPGGRRIVFTVWYGGSIDGCNIQSLDLETGERRTLIRGGADARYVPDGRLLFARSGRLMQVAFDAAGAEVIGTPEVVLEDLLTHPFSGAGNFAVASNGTLVYAPREAYAAQRAFYRMTETGAAELVDSDLGAYATPQLSPDGARLAATILDERLQIWLYDLERGGVERMTREGHNFWPVWTPDGERVAFTSNREGSFNLFWKAPRGDAPAERLTRGENLQFPSSWSPDGAWLAYSEFHPDTRWDIWMLPMDGDRKPVPFLQTEFDEFRPTFSPDGKLVAYVSNEGGRWDEHGRWEVYLRLRDDPGTRVQVSTEGGGDPAWSEDGSTLFFRQGDRLFAASVGPERGTSVGELRIVFDDLRLPESVDMIPAYDVAPDGSFLAMRLAQPARSTALTVVYPSR
jgi:DNA-binding winged helix-turn-helix (wHTH) protein